MLTIYDLLTFKFVVQTFRVGKRFGHFDSLHPPPYLTEVWILKVGQKQTIRIAVH